MLALGIRYLTGYAVATDVSNRGEAEWPPHPARIFMAMAAAFFETGENGDERAALDWLQRQPPPAIQASEADPRDVVTCYVPPNDYTLPRDAKKLKPAAVDDAIAIVPAYRTNKQPRTFPRVRPHSDTVYLLWPEALADETCQTALNRICAKVTRIGHSSSLVQMWVVESGKAVEANLLPDPAGKQRLRIVGEGTLVYLESAYNLEDIEAFADLEFRVAAAKGNAKAALKKQLTGRFDSREPTTNRPTISRWHGYRRLKESAKPTSLPAGAFDRELMILSIDEGPAIGLESTWSLLTALRDTIIKTCDPAPEWVSGHQTDRTPSQQPHLALAPLAFVGHEHADGHLLGVALAFPKGIDARERGRALGKMLYDNRGRPLSITVVLGALGAWTLVRETRESPPRALQRETWTSPADTWATVTPIVLDRHPKVDRAKDLQQWSLEVAAIVAESCDRQGLPFPVGIDVDRTCWHRGGPRATPGKGGGFPLMPVKPSQLARQQVHAWLRFDRPIEGPLLLGAGRYRGYGLCRPWKRDER